ncbi:amino acid/polyamine transporter I [Aspergillus caelatus]|uniref:Amino acid/polyamine transporter I n=1 Tax=Aspergillus caelatus TaxID=61420 RepID=A0A5N7ALH1_9EURO|nr:amino acid/polyamine transporter I [Aspergillus caelatus]KAE8369560.1 amino acid/polyamine transporter I [Aspergillus caelatus]
MASAQDRSGPDSISERVLYRRLVPDHSAGNEESPILDIETSYLNNKRRLGLRSTTLLLMNRIIGAAIFSVPSSIVLGVRSVGAALFLWLGGLALSFCGMFIWLELGCLMPRSGGEKLYLARAFPRPHGLSTTLYTFYILLGFVGLSCVVVVDNLLLAMNGNTSEVGKRAMCVGVLLLTTALQCISPDSTLRIMDVVSLVKIAILLGLVLTGLATIAGLTPGIEDPWRNFHHPFYGSSTDPYDYLVALLKILASFQGWHNAAYVLDEVKNPVRTLKSAGILGLGTVGILYLMANISCFIVANPDEIGDKGTRLVAMLLGIVFGDQAARITAAAVALSTFGSLISSSFALVRVVRELAEEGVIPAASLLTNRSASGTTTALSFFFLFGSALIAIVLLPFGDAYIFLVDVTQYQMAVVCGAVVIALLLMRRRVPSQDYPFRVWTFAPYTFLACQACLLLTPFISRDGHSDTGLPYWLAPVVALLSICSGGVYWWWRKGY